MHESYLHSHSKADPPKRRAVATLRSAWDAGSFEVAGWEGALFSGDPVAETVFVGTSVTGDFDVDGLSTVDTAGGEALLEFDKRVVWVARGLVLTGGVTAQRSALLGVAQIVALLIPVNAIVGVADFLRVSSCQTRVKLRLARQNDGKPTACFTPNGLPDGFNQGAALFADAFEVLLDGGVHFWDITKDVVHVGQPLLNVQLFLVLGGGHFGEQFVRTWALCLLASIQSVLHNPVHVVRRRQGEKSSRQKQEFHSSESA
eukprot:CAMPEP_0175091536 /NCGR_PEP_ID=MMETSP0086_2-20121207/1955_1 /TAXON_ID=136419 /ORGANISM="Unknown Unknown, Strain D1" /LENGTH=258 /DNA_ID=CAMNT_0016364285 /DNA_START=20 /DNA_END=792 /DNA_ORIENTATION=-